MFMFVPQDSRSVRVLLSATIAQHSDAILADHRHMTVRAIIQYSTNFALLCSDWPRNSHHSLNQSEAKLLLISAFYRTLGALLVFTLNSNWFLKIFSFLLSGSRNNVGFGFTTLNRRPLNISTKEITTQH